MQIMAHKLDLQPQHSIWYASAVNHAIKKITFVKLFYARAPIAPIFFNQLYIIYLNTICHIKIISIFLVSKHKRIILKNESNIFSARCRIHCLQNCDGSSISE